VTDEMASGALSGLAGGEAAYRAAYPGADPETLFELVHSDWLFRMPTLHLAQAHAAGGGRTFLYELCYPAVKGSGEAGEGLGACHAIDVPLVFGSFQALGQMLFGPEPPAGAVALGDLMRQQWAAFAGGGDPGWPAYAPGRRLTRIFDDPPDVASYPEEVSLHLWDQHRFDVIDLAAEAAER
jgi:para-nitrobenzyl esterase